MKKTLLRLSVLLAFVFSLSGLLSQNNALASQTDMLSYISITQYPAKTIYAKGESLDLTNMIVKGHYSNGTSKELTDYELIGYDSNLLGNQNLSVKYGAYYAGFQVTVKPERIVNLKVINYDTSSFTLSWKEVPRASSYEVFVQSYTAGDYYYLTSTSSNSIKIQESIGTGRNYKIRVVEHLNGSIHYGELSDAIAAATSPNKVAGLKVQSTSTSSVSLIWERSFGANGYLIYRSPANSNNFKLIGRSNFTSYTDKSTKSSTSYQYKISAYTLSESFQGEASDAVLTSTIPTKMALKVKVGDEKVRITWSKVTGATHYDLYISEDRKTYTQLVTTSDANTLSYVADGLSNQKTYYIYGVAKKVAGNESYLGQASSVAVVKPRRIETSTKAKYFNTLSTFKNSWAYTNFPFFRKNVNFEESIIIPGLITTNAGGFASTDMVPQGITFANDYLLITAYDLSLEENSVIYVMDKNTRTLLTTLVLPSKTHAGGIAFDETNIWIPTGKRVSSIPFAQIVAAVESGKPYTYIQYSNTVQLKHTASFLTYYSGELWIGTYNELSNTTMFSYGIIDKDIKPTLKVTDSIVMPNRSQGLSFTEDGYLIISRSCQTHAGMRGYMHQIDVYKPDLTKKGKLTLGKLVNSVDMPTMNEEIMVDKDYLYVNFESAAFRKSTYKMDRITAIDLKAVLGIKK